MWASLEIGMHLKTGERIAQITDPYVNGIFCDGLQVRVPESLYYYNLSNGRIHHHTCMPVWDDYKPLLQGVKFEFENSTFQVSELRQDIIINTNGDIIRVDFCRVAVNVCPDCNGTRQYVGLNMVEECKTCNLGTP